MKRILTAILIVFLLPVVTLGKTTSIDEEFNTPDSKRVRDEIVSAMLYMKTNNPNPVILKVSNEYQIIFEQEAPDNVASFLLKDMRTLKNPIMRTYFTIIPQGVKTQVRCVYEIVASSGTPYEMSAGAGANAKEYNEVIYFILGFVKMRIEKEYPTTFPEFIEKLENKPKIGINADNNGKIVSVVPNGLAAKAGVKKGDIILEINDEKVENNAHMLLLEKIEKGSILKLRLGRKTRKWNVKIQL